MTNTLYADQLWPLLFGGFMVMFVMLVATVTGYFLLYFKHENLKVTVVKFTSYQKLGVLVQDYLRAREYTEKGRMGDAGKTYESVLRKQMVEVLDEIHGKASE